MPRSGPRSLPALGADARVLGLDEAGRGSVLGPLVIGGYVAPASALEQLPGLGVRDSKLLRPSTRTRLARELRATGAAYALPFSPGQIDRAVGRHRLNRLEAEGFATLVRRTRPDAVVLDACEVDTDRFGKEVAGLAEFTGPLVAVNYADRDFPVVGAASIIAKVARDAAIARLARRLGTPIGSGYPSDPATRRYLASTLGRDGPEPAWVRRSWSTVATVMAERSRTTLERFDA